MFEIEIHENKNIRKTICRMSYPRQLMNIQFDRKHGFSLPLKHMLADHIICVTACRGHVEHVKTIITIPAGSS